MGAGKSLYDARDIDIFSCTFDKGMAPKNWVKKHWRKKPNLLNCRRTEHAQFLSLGKNDSDMYSWARISGFENDVLFVAIRLKPRAEKSIWFLMSREYLLWMLLFDRVIRTLSTEGAYSFVPVSKSRPRATTIRHFVIELSTEIVDSCRGKSAFNNRPGSIAPLNSSIK